MQAQSCEVALFQVQRPCGPRKTTVISQARRRSRSLPIPIPSVRADRQRPHAPRDIASSTATGNMSAARSQFELALSWTRANPRLLEIALRDRCATSAEKSPGRCDRESVLRPVFSRLPAGSGRELMRLPGSTYLDVMPRSGIKEPGNCASSRHLQMSAAAIGRRSRAVHWAASAIATPVRHWPCHARGPRIPGCSGAARRASR